MSNLSINWFLLFQDNSGEAVWKWRGSDWNAATCLMDNAELVMKSSWSQLLGFHLDKVQGGEQWTCFWTPGTFSRGLNHPQLQLIRQTPVREQEAGEARLRREVARCRWWGRGWRRGACPPTRPPRPPPSSRRAPPPLAHLTRARQLRHTSQPCRWETVF